MMTDAAARCLRSKCRLCGAWATGTAWSRATRRQAEAVAVYIRNLTAFHIRDFELVPAGDEGWADHQTSIALLECAKTAAVAYADALARHLGCALVSVLTRP